MTFAQRAFERFHRGNSGGGDLDHGLATAAKFVLPHLDKVGGRRARLDATGLSLSRIIIPRIKS